MKLGQARRLGRPRRPPLYLIDDVFGELDPDRRNNLLAACQPPLKNSSRPPLSLAGIERRCCLYFLKTADHAKKTLTARNRLRFGLRTRNPFCISLILRYGPRYDGNRGLCRSEHAAARRPRSREKAFGGLWFATGILGAKPAGTARVQGIGNEVAESLANGKPTRIPPRNSSASAIWRCDHHSDDSFLPGAAQGDPRSSDSPLCVGRPERSHAIGIVGTRKPSHYAAECAKKIAYQLAYAGLTVASGLARGIDTAAHKPRSRQRQDDSRSRQRAHYFTLLRIASSPKRSPAPAR